MPKIALHGKKESGKSTLADHLVEEWGYDAFAFAYNLKLDVINMGIPAWVVAKKPTIEWLRWLLQLYGGYRREEDPNYWVARCWKDIVDSETTRPVIEDMRYTNEAEWARAQGYKLIKIVKVGHMSADNHASEVDLDDWEDWDLIIESYPGDLVDIYAQMDDYLQELEDAENRSQCPEGTAT